MKLYTFLQDNSDISFGLWMYNTFWKQYNNNIYLLFIASN